MFPFLAIKFSRLGQQADARLGTVRRIHISARMALWTGLQTFIDMVTATGTCF